MITTKGKISRRFDAWIAEKRNLKGLLQICQTTDTFPSASKSTNKIEDLLVKSYTV